MGSPSRATNVRYAILAVTTLVAIMLYLDRYCLAFVARNIKDQLGLTQSQVDILQGAFFVTYAFGQLPFGWLADRYGARRMLTLYLFVWSVLTGMMGLSYSFAVLLLFRLGCGMFESGAYPACAGLIRRWVPYRQRGLASSIISLGGRIGGAITFPLTGYLLGVFTPISVSSELRTHEILDARAIAAAVVADPTVGPAPTPLTPPLSERVRAVLSAEQRAFLGGVAAAGAPAPTPEQVAHLTDLFNEALRRADLVEGLDLTPHARIIPEDALRWSAPGGPALTEAEVARRNRLLLEAAYPDWLARLHGEAWRPTLLVYGGTGVLLALIFWISFRDWPRQHPLVNDNEARLIEGDAPAAAQATEPPTPAGPLWRGILSNRGLWVSSFVQFGTNFAWVFLGTKLPEYLEAVHRVPPEERSWMAGLPFFLSLPMTIVGGWWTDRLTRRWGAYLGRSFPIGSTRLIAGAAFLSCLALDAPWPFTVAFCVMAVASDMGLPAIWAYNLDVGGKNVGLVLGWGNMWGNLGAAVSPFVLGLIQAAYGWDTVFLTCGVVFLVIGVASFGIDATRPVVTAAPGGAAADGAAPAHAG